MFAIFTGMELHNAKILITGGTTGIGFQTARLLKSKGAKVVFCGQNAERVEKAASGLGIKGIVCDVSKEADIEDLFKFTLQELGGLDVLVNNAGFGYFAPLTETDPADFERVWRTNVLGLFLAGKKAAEIFTRQQSGNIINIGSSAARAGFARGSAYVASKFAVSGLTECWRAELRPHNVRVMQVNPSEVVTEFGHKIGFTHDKVEKKLQPTEIAHLIEAMLTLPDVGFIPEAGVWATNPW